MTEAFPLAHLFLSAAPLPPSARTAVDCSALEASLRGYLEAGRRAWPDVAYEDADFVRYLAAFASAAEAPPVAYAGDLVLAFACSRGDARAITAFHRTYSGVISRVLSRRGADAGQAEDALQAVHERLLVGSPDAAPKISEYRGLGPLRSWVSTTAATTLLMLRRAVERRREQSADERAGISLIAEADPELGYLKERYKAQVHDAIVVALGTLGDRERTLLRLHLGQQMSIDQLGALYRVNRATAARWLASARKLILERARAELQSRLNLSESECNSIVALVRSQLDVSILQHLP